MCSQSSLVQLLKTFYLASHLACLFFILFLRVIVEFIVSRGYHRLTNYPSFPVEIYLFIYLSMRLEYLKKDTH